MAIVLKVIAEQSTSDKYELLYDVKVELDNSCRSELVQFSFAMDEIFHGIAESVVKKVMELTPNVELRDRMMDEYMKGIITKEVADRLKL